MLKRFLSHVLIGFATFILTATFFMWTIDSRVLDASVLSAELRKAGVSQELANLMPQIITTESDAGEDEKMDMMMKVSQAVTAQYIDQKIFQITDSVLTFVKAGEPQPVIDISDFPDRLSAVGVNVDDEFAENFNTPVQLNEDGQLDMLTNAYRIFGYIKYAGIALFAAVLLLEWYVSERGKKMRRLSRIFLYSGLSYLLYWVLLVFGPSKFSSNLNNSISANYDTSALVDAVLKAVQGLFAAYFIGFAVACLMVALVLYIVRHYKHQDVLPVAQPETPPAKAKK